MNHVLCGLAANVTLPSELVDRLIAVADDDIAASLADRADLSHAQAVALASRVGESALSLVYQGKLTARDIDPATQPAAALALLDERVGSPESARLLAADPSVEVREKLASVCHGLPPDVVETLAADSDVRVVAELALWTVRDVAAALAEHPHAEVRRAVAANEATSPAVLAMLISGEGLPPARSCLVCDQEQTPFVHDPQCARPDCDLRPNASCDGSHESTTHDLQLTALGNPSTPTEAVVGYVGHPSHLLRLALAARPDLPAEVCEKLAMDSDPGIRAELAKNPAIDDELIRKLAGDRSYDVQRSLAHHPCVPLDVLSCLAGATKIGSTLLPRIATATADEIGRLAEHPSAPVRMLLAQRRDLPAGIRDALATDSDAKVVKSIAPHGGLSDAQLRNMIDLHGVQVVAKVAANPEATAELLADLARHAPPVKRVFREIAEHPHATATALLPCLAAPRARHIAAGHPALPPRAIVELLTDADWRVVEAAAANPSLPAAVMSDLAR